MSDKWIVREMQIKKKTAEVNIRTDNWTRNIREVAILLENCQPGVQVWLKPNVEMEGLTPFRVGYTKADSIWCIAYQYVLQGKFRGSPKKLLDAPREVRIGAGKIIHQLPEAVLKSLNEFMERTGSEKRS